MNRMMRDGWKDWKQLHDDKARVLTRKAFVPNQPREKCHWARIQQWRVTKDSPWSIFYKYTFEEGEPWKELKVKKDKGTEKFKDSDLNQVHANGRQITKAKWLDLQKILKFVTKTKAVKLYKNLNHDGAIVPPPEHNHEPEEEPDDSFWKTTDKWLPKDAYDRIHAKPEPQPEPEDGVDSEDERKHNCTFS